MNFLQNILATRKQQAEDLSLVTEKKELRRTCFAPIAEFLVTNAPIHLLSHTTFQASGLW